MDVMGSEKYIFETSRLGFNIANPNSDIHCGVYLELFDQPRFKASLDGALPTQSLETVRKFLQHRWTDMYEKWGYGNFIVWLKPSADPSLSEPKAIGQITMVRSPEAPAPDLGYAMLDAYHGKGYATEACQGVMDYCREKANQKWFLIYTNESNRPSIALAERLGFKLVTVARLPQFDNRMVAVYVLGAEGLDVDVETLVNERLSKLPREKRENEKEAAAAVTAPIPESEGISDEAAGKAS